MKNFDPLSSIGGGGERGRPLSLGLWKSHLLSYSPVGVAVVELNVCDRVQWL